VSDEEQRRWLESLDDGGSRPLQNVTEIFEKLVAAGIQIIPGGDRFLIFILERDGLWFLCRAARSRVFWQYGTRSHDGTRICGAHLAWRIKHSSLAKGLRAASLA